LLAQDGLVPIELTFEERELRLDTLLVYRLPEDLLEHCLFEDVGRDRVELRILHARRLLEFRTSPGLRRDQLRAGSERGEVAADSARLEELEAVLQLLDRQQKKTTGENAHQNQYAAATVAGGKRETTTRTHDYVWHLAERLVREVLWLLVFAHRRVDGDDFVGDAALSGDVGDATRASGLREAVKSECHGWGLIGCKLRCVGPGCAALELKEPTDTNHFI
jgi:hypothetical protein